MGISERRGTAGIMAAALLAVVFAGYGSASAAALQKQEQKCGKVLGKAGAKFSQTVARAVAACRERDLDGPATACPDATANAEINAGLASLATSIEKSCLSVCSVSNALACIDNDTCPPIGTGAESCAGSGGTVPFQISQLNYPGPYCEAVVGHKLVDPQDVSACVAELTANSTQTLIDVTYGSLSNATAPSDGARACLGAINKSVQKLSSTIYKSASKCRSAIYKGKSIANPADCRTTDPKLVAKVDKLEAKLASTVQSKCTNAQILELDLCNNGVGGTLNTTDASACLIAAANEITDTDELPVNRDYSEISIVNGAFPPLRGVCGDNLVNQAPSNFAVLGEECDGTDDSACPGLCIPPGDLYECTCADRALIRYLADGLNADLDNGWTGTSQNQAVADRAGYVTKLTGCDCSSMTGATCDGAYSDPECEVEGFQLPNCSWDPLSPISCDAHGNNNGSNQNVDCNICDEFTTTPGTFCQNNSNCQARCYDTNGDPQGTCTSQAVCPAGQRCRGQCETTHSCVILTNGAPLPISSGGTAVCILTKFRDNVTGTRNIFTGEHAVFISQFSQVHLGVTNSVPCPVCGGFCAGGPRDGEICEGTCSDTEQGCRFDTDCPPEETCTTTSASCPGSTCNLSLVCGGGPSANPTGSSIAYGQPCRVEAKTRGFGTTSSDCLPITGKNISGDGLEINFFPSTSESVVLPAVMPCTGPGYELFDCPCTPGVGAQKRPTQPNLCAGACDAGVNENQGCGTGAGNINGEFTKCAGGINELRACDEDSDCPGSTCTANPTHCTGGPPADELKPCSSDAECNGGTCVDACPGGRCVPLCLPTPSDGEDGYCAAGPNFYHCSGENDTFRTCTASQANGTCNSVCSTSCAAGVPSGGSMTPCDGTVACPSGEACCGQCNNALTCGAGDDGKYGTEDDVPGAGVCVPDIRNCFINDLASEGGDIYNGDGDPTNVRTTTVFCIAPTSNGAVNQTAGLGGPGRLRQSGVNQTNGVLP